jgi:small-conductance mechanosensitive channel
MKIDEEKKDVDIESQGLLVAAGTKLEKEAGSDANPSLERQKSSTLDKMKMRISDALNDGKMSPVVAFRDSNDHFVFEEPSPMESRDLLELPWCCTSIAYGIAFIVKHLLSIALAAGLATASIYMRIKSPYVEFEGTKVWRLLALFSGFFVTWILAVAAKNVLRTFADFLSHTRVWIIWFYFSAVEIVFARTFLFIGMYIEWIYVVPTRGRVLEILFTITFALMIAHIILFVRQILLKFLVWNLEGKNFLEQAKQAQFLENIISRLAKVAFEASLGRTPSGESKYLSQPVSAQKLFTTLAKVKSGRSQFSSQSSREYESRQRAEMFEAERIIELRSQKQCRKQALKLWDKLNKDGKKTLHIDDFKVWFPSSAEAEAAFFQLKQGSFATPITCMDDIAGPPEIELDVWLASIERMREQRLALSTDLQTFSSVLSVLASVIHTATWIVIPLTILAVLGVSLNTILLSATTVLVSLSFALASVLSRMVESAYFMLITRPYKVGDRIRYGSRDSEILIIQSISVMTTTALLSDNHAVILPNYELARSKIYCLNKGEGSMLAFRFQVDMRTSKKKIEAFREAIRRYLTDNIKDFKPSALNLYYEDVDRCNMLTFSVWVPSR